MLHVFLVKYSSQVLVSPYVLESSFLSAMSDREKAAEEEGATGAGVDEEGDPPASSLIPEVLCEYMKIPAGATEVTIMAKVRATVQQDENRRAPITICAAVDRRYVLLGIDPECSFLTAYVHW